MSDNRRQTFFGITRSIFTRLRKRASKTGIHVAGPAGEAEKDGVRIQWKYDEAQERLEVECVRAPFWIDSIRVNHELRREIESVLESSRAA
jgi:hypothetical protein